MPKIEILTFVNVNSFGAVLQCYALSKIVEQMGHTVEIIDFRLPSGSTTTLGQLGDIVQRRQFSRFCRKFMPAFTRHYKTSDELINDPPLADCYIVGSDQVWNMHITKKLAATYFLDFVPAERTKIAYAASFGNVYLERSEEDRIISECLSRFNSISVREESGLNILRNNFQRQAEVVLDPTLLMNNYDEIVPPCREASGELISYRLANDPEYLRYLRPLSNKLNLMPVLLNDRRINRGFKYRPFVGIEEWLRSVSNASFIITDSFHCMVFAIIFRKNFIALPSHPDRTSRLTDLLKKLGIEERFFGSLHCFIDSGKCMEPIDYERVSMNLEKERTKSMSFLRNALKDCR